MSDALGYNDLIGNEKNSSFEELLTKDDSQNTTYFTGIYRLSQTNCTKLKMDFYQILLLKFSLVKQSLITI